LVEVFSSHAIRSSAVRAGGWGIGYLLHCRYKRVDA
jgi:hypothetical protein